MNSNTKRATLAGLAVLSAIALPGVALAAADQIQIEMIRRAQQAKQALARTRAAAGAERDRLIEEHMALTRTLLEQMRAAQPGAELSPAQQRAWIDEHLRLMQEVLHQMDEMHRLLLASAPR